uniref:Uncharacterized protein n=1 Tax=Minutocellus polymorphus TaxID=265543 RepID=A0A7S0ABY1_9STRA|mmetsp:Transcript_10422/g.17243  ORF Transcript_10422/g.17243 Transcript_10422/m.17243 type:complete len:315 (+) Transcript_10422:102-1046(+)|eukprot:CAMPEP_0197716060 /NCGR_PEP_ID=MMETSP1434-20131217/1092_1 /TAXON_ID=265543 /ORGANISM="Minutocellus polymorphus, Strain CCMP3303" /LENGTH=314 /DNA_ID=CAMNT_0043300365 /DNA_START=95 /DNA_END=1039 /DNA_ORIENTATION=+
MRRFTTAVLALPLMSIAAVADAEVGSHRDQKVERLQRRLRRRLTPFVSKVQFTDHEVDDIWKERDIAKHNKEVPEEKPVDDVPPVVLPEEATKEDEFVCKSAGTYCGNKAKCEQYTDEYEADPNGKAKMDCFCGHAWGFENMYCDETKGFDSKKNCACDDDTKVDDLARDDVELNDPEVVGTDLVAACVRYSLGVEDEYEWITERISKEKYTRLVISEEGAVLPEECTKHFEDCDPNGLVCAENEADRHHNDEVEDETETPEEEDDEADDEETLLEKKEMEKELREEEEVLEAKIKELESILKKDRAGRKEGKK